MKKPIDGAGDTWTWTALEAETKLIVSYFIGGRDSDCAKRFMDDVASRLANRVQLTSDGHKAYLNAVERAFVHALALYFVHYNWMRIHETLRVTPAMAAGLTGKLMGWEDIIAIMDNKVKDALTQKRAAMLDELPYSTETLPSARDDMGR